MKRRSFTIMAQLAALGCSISSLTCFPCIARGQQSSSASFDARQSSRLASHNPTYLGFAQFQIPFSVDSVGAEPAWVQLWVSTDQGQNWQLHARAKPDAKHFDFRAAAEGLYLFSVRTIDATGAAFPSLSPPLRVEVDTTRPLAALRADFDSEGKLLVDVRVMDNNLNPDSAELRLRTNRDAEWQTVQLGTFSQVGEVFEGQASVALGACREVALVFSVEDHAHNFGEASFKLDMPRTAAGDQEMKLASTGGGSIPNSGFPPGTALQPIAGATPWDPEPSMGPATAHLQPRNSPGQLAGTSTLSLEPAGDVEELPLPAPSDDPAEDARMLDKPVMTNQPSAGNPATELVLPDASERQYGDYVSQKELTGVERTFHCKSRAFSLDYSVESLGGNVLAAVELWGTEDAGQTWVQWGVDPDRQSPFDVQVGNDGLFGFRMVIVGSNGIVTNRPKQGDTADVWIQIDTLSPTARITRAVYGQGPEDGMLVIDYTCSDSQLVDQPISLSYSQRPNGPWTTIDSGLKNTGIYLWKADSSLPEQIYLKLEVVDKAGNLGHHRLDLPIDTGGFSPRGRIQGFRPIMLPSK